ncbi:MAG: damage-inducible protein DinB [Alphaproteobacteria bacterium]|nr:damage-inducible protein DinB [Alphaproteobacteria bacterium]
MKEHYATFAAYNSWANRLLYAAAARLPDALYRQDRGAFCGSLHGTLNHLLVADRVWMHRFTRTGDAPTQLDAILHDRLDDLRAAREAEDDRIARWIDGLGEGDLAGMIRYRRVTAPDDVVQPLHRALAHFFNHQTLHRGQAHGLLTALGGRDAAPELDLLYFERLRERGGA